MLTAIVTRANAVITAVGLVQHSRGLIEEWGPPVHTLNASAADDAHAIPIHAFRMVLERIFTARFCVVNPPLIKQRAAFQPATEVAIKKDVDRLPPAQILHRKLIK